MNNTEKPEAKKIKTCQKHHKLKRQLTNAQHIDISTLK